MSCKKYACQVERWLAIIIDIKQKEPPNCFQGALSEVRSGIEPL